MIVASTHQCSSRDDALRVVANLPSVGIMGRNKLSRGKTRDRVRDVAQEKWRQSHDSQRQRGPKIEGSFWPAVVVSCHGVSKTGAPGPVVKVIIIIIIIKRIQSRAPIYHTRWEHRALYNNTNDRHRLRQTHTDTYAHAQTQRRTRG